MRFFLFPFFDFVGLGWGVGVGVGWLVGWGGVAWFVGWWRRVSLHTRGFGGFFPPFGFFLSGSLLIRACHSLKNCPCFFHLIVVVSFFHSEINSICYS